VIIDMLFPSNRAEWSTYVVSDTDPNPRFLVLDGLPSTDSFDRVDIKVAASTVNYTVDSNRLQALVERESDGTFVDLIFPFPEPFDDDKLVAPNTSWSGVANDYIYWLNGVTDRAFYNGAVATTMISIDPTTVAITQVAICQTFVTSSVPDQVSRASGVCP
jgi:hypothetical protein